MESDVGKVKLFVCGRVCLFGEHSDWAAQYGLHEGLCLVNGTDQGLAAVAEEAEQFVVQTQVAQSAPAGRRLETSRWRQMSCPWQKAALLEAARDEDEFFRHCAGVAHEMASHPLVTGPINLRITAMDLPLRKGVSSSAAVCILVAKAFDAVYNLELFPHELMELAYRGERLTGSRCGRMDQACIYGKTPVLVTFGPCLPACLPVGRAGRDSSRLGGRDTRSVDVRVEPVFPSRTIHMFFVDLAGRKNTIRILDDLQRAYPSSPILQRALGQENERIVRSAYRALTDGSAEKLGALMREAQQVFDESIAPHSPEELASPLLHEVLAFDQIAEHVWGGKGVGSQGDGTAQLVARSRVDRDAAMAKIARAFPQMRCFPLTIAASGPRLRTGLRADHTNKETG